MGKTETPKKQEKTSGAELYFFLYKMLRRRESLMARAEEFRKIDTALRCYFTGVPSFSIGNYRVSGGWEKSDGGRKIWKTEITKF